MNKYICVLCGSDNYNWGNNPAPFFDRSSGKCCNKCDILLVLVGRLMGYKSISEQLNFMDEMSDDLPTDVKKHVEQVIDHLATTTESKEYWDAAGIEELHELFDDVEEVVEEKEPLPFFGRLEWLCMLEDALSTAIEREHYEAASKIHKRMKELGVK